MIEEYIVILESESYINKFKSFLNAHNMKYEYLNNSRSFLITTTKPCISCISTLYYVKDIDNNIEQKVEIEKVIPYIPDSSDEPEDPGYYLNYAINKLNIPSLWKKGYTGKGIKVAVVDTGIAPNQPYLNIKGNVSFVSGEGPEDIIDHGTGVAGVIAARGFNENCYGIAYDCDLYNVKVLARDGKSSTWDICEGLQWCIDNKMDVINMSITWNFRISDEELTALQNVIKRAGEAGVILVMSTGNDGRTPLFPPSDYKPSFAIGATDESDVRWYSSNYGEGIDFVAPGVAITTTAIPRYVPVFDKTTNLGTVNGTSFAAPQVTGLIALLLSYNKNLSFEKIKQILIGSAIHLGTPGYNIEYGYGRVNAPNL